MKLTALLRTNAFWDRVEVAHRLPGRLRLKVQDLARIPETYAAYVMRARALIERLPGVTSVSVSFVTQNVLFLYEPGVVSESELLNWLEALYKEGLEQFAGFDGGKDPDLFLRHLRSYLEDRVEAIRTEHAQSPKNRTVA